MTSKKLIFSFLFLITTFAYSQNNEKYTALIAEASNLYDVKEFAKSGEKYSEAFKAFGNRGLIYDRYNAACSWSLANKPDSAFVQLNKIAINAKFQEVDQITKDVDFNSLHKDKRWSEVISIIKSNKEKAEANLDKVLVQELNTINEEDQKYRLQIEEIEKNFGANSNEIKDHWKLINETDSINLIKVSKILDEKGWLGNDVIGNSGNSTLFLVIQHADLATQEKYLPMMREAVSKGNANSSSLALLEDRVALRKGNRQIYGSQIGRTEKGEYFVSPLENPENVDERRQKVGLGKLQDYISRWGLKWDVEAYKKQLPELEKKK